MTGGPPYDIDVLLDEVVTLPSMPESLIRITDLINDPNSTMNDIAQAIAMEPSIAFKTLRIVNSAYYGLGQEVKTVEHAVVLLGMKVIKNLVLTATVFQAIEGAADRFLKHAIACGIAMRTLARTESARAKFDSAEEAFLYGLLHDIGKVILEEYLPDACARVHERVRDEGLAWHEAEQAVIGVDHAEVGSQLALKWKLDPAVADAIAGHHDIHRVSPEHQCYAATLAVANYLCGAAGYGAYPKAVLQMDQATWDATGLSPDTLDAVASRFFSAIPDIDDLLMLAA